MLTPFPSFVIFSLRGFLVGMTHRQRIGARPNNEYLLDQIRNSLNIDRIKKNAFLENGG